MLLKKRSVQIIAFILCIISFAVLVSNLFQIPSNAGQEYYMDKVFYYGILIVFWLTAPYLLSVLVRKVIWKSEFKNSISASMIGRIEDFITIAIYLISLGILSTKLFDFEFTLSTILLGIVLLVILAYARPMIVRLTKTGFIQSARPFKVGDWISLLNQNGINVITGKVIRFDLKSVQLKSENDTLLLLPNSLLSNYIIENYRGLKDIIQLYVHLSLGYFITIEQARRIIIAGTKHALLTSSADDAITVDVLITKINKDVIDYRISFLFSPWNNLSPDKMKDLVLTNIADHLKIAGFDPYGNKKEYNLLEHVSLFHSLRKEDVRELFSTAQIISYKAGERIIQQGEKGSSMFILQEGILSVSIVTEKNANVNVAYIYPGQFFGEMSLFTGEERSATVNAISDAVILEITKETMKPILELKPDLVNNFGEIIAERQSINLKIMEDYLNRKESLTKKIITSIKTFFNMKS